MQLGLRLIEIIITVPPESLYRGLLGDFSLKFSGFVLSIFCVCEKYGAGKVIF